MKIVDVKTYIVGNPPPRRGTYPNWVFCKLLTDEGVEGWVPYRGNISDIVAEFVGGLKAAMGYVGAATIPEIGEKAKLAIVTERGSNEIKPHDIMQPGPKRGP